MARNVRQKYPVTPVKVSKRRGSDSSSSLDLSDDDGYSAVEDISDSEDDEENVNAVEEEALTRDLSLSPRPKEEDEEGDDEGEEGEEDEDDEDEDEDEDDDDDDDDDDEDEESVDESTSWEGFDAENGASVNDVGDDDMLSSGTAVERRVRFDVPDSDGDSTETDEDLDFFPDIFVDQSSLDPSFRREIENDPDDSSNSGTFWDYHTVPAPGASEIDSDLDVAIKALDEDDDSTPVATPMASQEIHTAVSTPVQSTEDDDLSLDGYDSEGDTTEEEDPPEQPIRRKSRREAVEEASDSDAIQIIKPRRHGQPRIGRFDLDCDGKKPIAVVHPKTGKMMIFTPQRLRKLDLSPESFNFQFFQGEPQSSPILSNSGNVMMSGMMFASNTFGDFMNTQAVGPAEAFFALSSDAPGVEESSEYGEDEDEDEEEKTLHLDDFIHFGDDSSDDEKDGDMDLDQASHAVRPMTASSDAASSLLDHFSNPDVVGVFRRDQANHQLLSRSKATRDSLAFSGPLIQGTLRGIKDGRIATTNVPISPMRKHRKTPQPGVASSPLSAMSQKRKASAEHNWGHKRQRSIPDVDLLSITS